MEWKSNLRRTQSLRSVYSSCDKPSWTEGGLPDKIISVSQLVARYQTTVEVSTSVQEISEYNGEAKPKQTFKEIKPSLLESKETHLESLMRRNEAREQSRDKTNLTRSKSVGSLHSGAGSIGALKALFESKAATQNKVKSSFRAASLTSPYMAADITPVVNGDGEEVKSSAEEPKIQIPADAKTDHVMRKVVNQTRLERRKTIGGIDFETIATSQADEKRRSIADFRDSSFLQTKEKLSVSVKAMSALYMSKVAPQDSTLSLLKSAQGQSSESGKRIKVTKMTEKSQQRKDDLPPALSARHQLGPEDISWMHSPQSMPSQFSKEELYQQRQKCELRRLLKHTHPELKTLDDVVDEELAEVLSSETGVTTGETGYEGEVLSRRLIFENCALNNKASPYTPKMHKADGTVGRDDACKTSAVFEEHEGRPCYESYKGIVVDDKTIGSGQDLNRERGEEMIRIDVQATRKIFESQSVNTPNLDNDFQGKVSIHGVETGAVQKRKQELVKCSKENLHSENKNNACTKSLDLTNEPHKQGPCVHNIGQSTYDDFSSREEVFTGETVFEGEPTRLPDQEECGEVIKTSAALFQNNPFIATNIEREHSFVHKSQNPAEDNGAVQDYLVDNVKNRAHLFESMPFDQIRHQNKDELETMVENIRETLNSLYRANAVHSHGSIIEVNETMIAKKAKFTLSESGPKIKCDEVAEGGAQNFILQLLPRANLKPQITYLKEDSKGSMEATVVNVPLPHLTTNQEAEFKTANVAQVVEDILNQDNSLRKGVVIQEDVDRCAEVVVYSLYNYFDGEDVKRYYPPQGAEYDNPEPERGDVSKTDNQPTSLPDQEEYRETTKTSAALFQNNPFIVTKTKREHSFMHKSQSPAEDNGAAQDYLVDNVKNRAHLFESMPFDQIRHQNKDEIDTRVENIKETLNTLYRANAVHSHGSIIEVNETMIAKKAKFTLSESGPKIKYDEVAEGGAQNFILQLLPRANLKPQITYLKEDSKGSMKATVVNVPLPHLTTNQEAEFKTANVAQVVEDILNQDNSLRKGVVIQEVVDRCAEIIVYALYNYFDEEDVKSYYPPQGAEYDKPEPEQGDVSKTDNQPKSLPDKEEYRETTKTSAALFQNNPFIATKTKREHSFMHKSQSPAEDNGAVQDYLVDNVKNTAHLFESMPFDQIRHQNKDEIDTRVENIKETLNTLYRVNAVHSHGSIIEVNETMIAKKAKFTLSESGPKIKYDEVAEGGAQNFILQLLPRANLKPQITYLKEDSKGSMEATVVNVPLPHLTTNQEAEFKTANVAQVVEDILNQDNSLRKGVVIQEVVDRCAEIIIYSLYNYFDEENVKRYYPPQGAEYDKPEPERGDVSKTDNQELRKGIDESTINCLLETPKDQTCPEIRVKGNVQLFKSCIEKGDLEYLKTLWAEPIVQEQEFPPNQNVAGQGMEQRGDQAEESSEWAPVDVKKLKSMFTGDQRPTQPKHYVCENLAQSTTISCAFTGQNMPLGKSQSSTECIHGQVKNSFRECGGQTTEKECNDTVAPQGSYLHLEAQDHGWVHQAELVEVVDDKDEISNFQSAIHNLQQDKIDSKYLHQSSQQKHKYLAQEPIVLVTESNVKQTEAELSQEKEDQKKDPCTEPTWDELLSTSNLTSEHKSDNGFEEVQTTEVCCKMAQKDTEVDQKQQVQAALMSAHGPETTTTQQEDDEVVFEGKLQAALDSLERSNINVKRGDFKAAMIYRNASKKRSQNVCALSAQTLTKEEFCPVTEPKFTQATLTQGVSKEQMTATNAEPLSQGEALNKPATSAASEKIRKPVGPKPAIPPKPEHLKVKQRDIQSTDTADSDASRINSVRPEDTVPQPLPTASMSLKDEHKQSLFKINTDVDTMDHQINMIFDEALQMTQETEVRHQVQGSVVTLESGTTKEEKKHQDFPIKESENMNETDESHVDFHAAYKKFGGKNTISAKNAPVKPKRVKIAQPDNRNLKHVSGDNSRILTQVDEEPQQTLTGPSCNNANTCRHNADSKDEQRKEMNKESKVEMREKKGRTETEDERRQRLSVHMDEIMRGNTTAAMEIFDNLRKQEELKSILCRVEEIEQDTSEVDVRSLRKVFENVPDWVVSSKKKKQNKAKAENKVERMTLKRDNTESKFPMAHVFGDLERASEEIMNLKEQILARLVDIEEALKKALYSVSTLKSDSDIAGLSSLFKESLGTEEGSLSSGSISKISIESSRTKSLQTHENPTAQGNTALPASHRARSEVAPTKQRASPQSSPAFISIQSAARKKTEALPPETTICPTCQHIPKTEEKFRTTKTLVCNSPAQNRKRDSRKGGNNSNNPKRELSVLEVQTDHEGNSVTGSKTVKENYERTDHFGNRFYSSKTSTVVTGQPETTTSTSQAAISPTTYQISQYPEVQLSINQKP